MNYKIFKKELLTHFFYVLIISLFASFPLNAQIISNKSRNTSSDLHLMPIPAKVKINQGAYRLNKDFTLTVNEGAHARLFKGADRFLRRLDGRTGMFFSQGYISKANPQKKDNPGLIISAKQEGKVQLNEDESYQLLITSQKITLEAATDIGALRGLETLLQLLEADEQGYYFPAIEISDQPRFPWRGLMLDVARHYQPMEVLKRNLDAMAAMKMNVLHFHLCDDQGWRVESKTFPKLHQLASDGLYYSHEEIKELVDYAEDRGIRVMPEFDVPGHATAILVAYPELGSAPGPYQLERASGVFDPVLNPGIDETYNFLDKLFSEMATLFPDPYLHIGGDENNGRHWKSNPEIQAFMKKNQINSVLQLQTYFNNRLIKSIQRLNKKMVGWEEILQPGLSKDAIIHSWKGRASLYKAASEGYQTILSHGYYIDLLQPASEHYLNDPLPEDSLLTKNEKQYTLSPEQKKLILGGEATMWAELVTPVTIDSRIWPRTAAIAERLCSHRDVKDVNDMYRRLDYVSFRLEELGLSHLKNREVILRNLSNGQDITPLKVLADVIEPYKVYSRNNGGQMYLSYSPFTLMADAAIADARDARKFRELVNQYSLNSGNELKEKILYFLELWKDNHKAFMKIATESPVLKPMEDLSEKLSMAAALGIEALHIVHATESWYREKTAFIQQMKKETEQKKNSEIAFEDGRTELVVLDPIQKLLDLTNPEAARKMVKKIEAAPLNEH